MRVPTMSAGTRSGVNWMRANVPPTTRASVSTASVLATPGTPSSRQCPRASRATNMRSIIRSWPTITRLTSNSARSSRVASWAGVVPVEAVAGGPAGVPDGWAPGWVAGMVGWATGPPRQSACEQRHKPATTGPHARREAARTGVVACRAGRPITL